MAIRSSPYLDEEDLMAPSEIILPSDDEIDKLLAQHAFALPSSEQSIGRTESLPSSPNNDYVIFKATSRLPYEDIYPPFNYDLDDYSNMLYVTSNPNPHNIPSIVPPLIAAWPTSL